MTETSGADRQVTVRLIRLPVPVHVAASAHQDALQREFDVLRGSEDQTSVPHRLLALIDELESRFGSLNEQPAGRLAEAIEHGDDTVDLEYEVPPEAGEASTLLDAMLDEVDDYCRQGEHLLTLATSQESAAYRRWFLGEFAAQVSGAPPTPWDEFARRAPIGAGGAPRATGDRQEPARNGTDHAADPAGTAPTGAAPTGTGREDAPWHVPDGWSVEERDHEVIVRPSGELDLQTAPQVRDLVQSARREHTTKVELDLTAVDFIDSVGLSMIVSAHQRLASDGVGMVVVVPTGLQRLFEISGLGQLLDLRT